jgi:hypothetical protein
MIYLVLIFNVEEAPCTKMSRDAENSSNCEVKILKRLNDYNLNLISETPRKKLKIKQY